MAKASRRRSMEQALARLRERLHTTPPEPEPVAGLSTAAFRAVVDERLRGLERELGELKGRINGLLFLLAGAVASQIVLRLLA